MTKNWLLCFRSLFAFVLIGMLGACEPADPKPTQPRKAKLNEFDVKRLADTQTTISNHISGRTRLARYNYRLEVKGLSAAQERPFSEGFCGALETLNARCVAAGAERKNEAIRLKLTTAKSAGNSATATAEIDGTLRLNEGHEDVGIKLELLATGASASDEATWHRQLGRAFGARWREHLTRKLSALQMKLKPSSAVRWVASPGLRLKSMFPSSVGVVMLSDEQAWTFQGDTIGAKAAFGIDHQGKVSISRRFSGMLDASSDRLSYSLTPSGRSVLQTSLGLNSKDDGIEQKGTPAVVSSFSSGFSKLFQLEKAMTLGAAVADTKDRIYIPLQVRRKIMIVRSQADSKMDAEWRLPMKPKSTEQLLLLWLTPTRLAVISVNKSKPIYAIDIEKPKKRPAKFWRWKHQGLINIHTTPIAPDSEGGLLLIDTDPKTRKQTAVHVGRNGKSRWSKVLPEGLAFKRIMRVGALAVLMGRETHFLNLADGAQRFTKKVKSHWAIEDAQKRIVACADPGLIAWSPKGKQLGVVRLDRACREVRAQSKGGFLASRFLTVIRIEPVDRW